MGEKSLMMVYEVSIYPLYFIPEILTYKFSDFIGCPRIKFPLTQEWKNRTLRGVGDMDATNEMAYFVLDKIKKDDGWIEMAIKKYYLGIKELVSLMEEISKSNLAEKSNNELADYFEEFRKRYMDMYLWGWVPNAAEGLRNVFSKYLEERLRSYTKDDSKFSEYLSILTLSTKPMLREDEQIGLLNLVKFIKSDLRLNEIFSSNDSSSIIKELKQNNIFLFDKIERHRKEFAWILFKYEGPEWDLRYLIDLIKEELGSNYDVDEKIRQIIENKKDISRKQTQYAKDLGLSDEDNRLFRIARELMALKEDQKDNLFKVYFFLDKLVKESSTRLFLSDKQFRHMIHQEIVSSLKGQRDVDSNLLNSRIKHCLMTLREGEPIMLYVGNEADTLSKIEFPKLPEVDQFKGQCACPGIARGKAIIVQETKDMYKMESGAILVTTRTNPNLLPAMRKAAAIAADIGGVGSHAAIVSRELNIPCVVGLENASMILKDGDLVEVDANTGIVRKIK